MNKKRKKNIIMASIILIVVLAIGIGIGTAIGYSHFKDKNTGYTSTDRFSSIKELVEYYDCEYKGIKKSEEEDYEKDLYITFSEDPLTEDGYSNEWDYDYIISEISAKMEEKDYRIIDEDKNLIARIKFAKDGEVNYTINNTTNYFEKLRSLYTLNNEKKDNIIQANIVSAELRNIMKNNWIRRASNLGEKTSSCANYDIYWDKGYKVRTINDKIYNIIFTNNYSKEILQGITTGMTDEEIKSILGEPIYYNDTDVQVIGYKLDSIYVFFTDGEVSIYRSDEYDEEDNKKFASLMTKLNEDKDYNTFIKELTNLYPDYSTFEQEEDHVNIRYPLRGFEIYFGQDYNNGATIYKNFQGNITEDVSIDDIRNNKPLPANTYLDFEWNLVFSDEVARANSDMLNRSESDAENFEKGELAQSNEYIVYYDNIYKKYTFYSTDKKKLDFSINVQNATGIYNLRDNLFVYGIANDGIYVINAYTMQTNKIVSSTGECVIDKIENNVIYYDNTSISVH